MSYGTPALNPEGRVYRIVLNQNPVTQSGDLICTLSGGYAADAATDAFFQAFIDLVNSSPDFTIMVAEKTTPSVQAITATAN